MDSNTKLDALKKFYAEMPGKDYFELLGIGRDATDTDVRSAYFGLMKQFGADYFHQVNDAASRTAIDEVNKQLRAAYDALGKSSKREAYLASLNGNAPKEENSSLDIAAVFEAEQALSQAKALIERGEFKVAQQRLEKAKKIDNKSLEVCARLAYVNYMLMEVDANGKRSSLAVKDIVEQLENVKEELKSADYVCEYLGEISKIEGDSQKALKYYKQALKLNGDNVRAKREVMLIEQRQKAPENASDKKKTDNSEPTTFFEKLKALLNKKL